MFFTRKYNLFCIVPKPLGLILFENSSENVKRESKFWFNFAAQTIIRIISPKR